MNMTQDKDLAIKFDAICRKLRESGKDLSKIPIVLDKNSTTSYITKRIMEELRGGEE